VISRRLEYAPAIFAGLEDIYEHVAASNPIAASGMIERIRPCDAFGGISWPRPTGPRRRHARTRHPAYTVHCTLSGQR
jgi:hypothetical protein